jgi:uncharacterized protein (TIGR02391 family)
MNCLSFTGIASGRSLPFCRPEAEPYLTKSPLVIWRDDFGYTVAVMNLETQISHDLWAAVRRSYESQAWSNAILDGIYHLSDVIRSRTGLQSDGTALAGQALGGKSPKLRLNKLQTESDQSIQTGVEQLLRGIFQAIRNPRSHGRLEDSQADADSLLVFINYVLGLIDHARTSFSLDEAVSRALDENFVPNERYAGLVVDEIPQRQLLQVGLAVFERQGKGSHKRLPFFFQALLERLSPEDRGEFFAALSADLRDSSDDDSLRLVLQILRPEQWPELSEVARLRSENRLLRNFRDGGVNLETGKCSSGALATWSPQFWPQFTLKNELMDAAIDKLSSSRLEAQEFARQFALPHLPSLADKPSFRLQFAIANRIKGGDAVVYKAVKYGVIWTLDVWNKIVTNALTAYEHEQPPLEDDDIPF